MSERQLVWLRGGGDLGTGVGHRLRRAGFPVVVSEVAQPTVVRRAVSFANAVYEREWEVENERALLVRDERQAMDLLRDGRLPLLIDPTGEQCRRLSPDVMVDARMLKRDPGTRLSDAPLVIGLGPGFVAATHAHAVVETQRGHNLGKVIFSGSAAADSGVPGSVAGFSRERVLYAPTGGLLSAVLAIGDRVEPGQLVARVGDELVTATIGGVLRGLLHDGLAVHSGQKLGDIDPRGIRDYCFTISDKARSIGGGVLEAILCLSGAPRRA